MKNEQNKFHALKKVFHEPSRLAILSALCVATNGLSFGELKEACALTDGNLSRHLKALKECAVVRIEKAFINDKPRTTVFISQEGLAQFQEYLDALESVLEQARESLPVAKKDPIVPGAERGLA